MTDKPYPNFPNVRVWSEGERTWYARTRYDGAEFAAGPANSQDDVLANLRYWIARRAWEDVDETVTVDW